MFRKYRGSKKAQNCRILCNATFCHDKSRLNLIAFKNSCELCLQTFSRAFLKVVKTQRVGVIIFKGPCRIK